MIGKRADRVDSWLFCIKSINDRVDEVECGEGEFTWVGAHPSLGNKVTFGHSPITIHLDPDLIMLMQIDQNLDELLLFV